MGDISDRISGRILKYFKAIFAKQLSSISYMMAGRIKFI